MDTPVVGERVVVHLLVAVPTVEEVEEDALPTVLRLRGTALCPGNQDLHLLKIFSGDDWFMDILEDHPVLRVVLHSPLVLEGLGVGLEVDDIPAVFLLREDFLNRRFAPLVGVRLGVLPAPRETLALPVGHGDQYLLILEYAGNGLIAFSLKTHLEDASDHLRRLRVDDPLLFVLWVLPVPIGRLGQRFAGVAPQAV